MLASSYTQMKRQDCTKVGSGGKKKEIGEKTAIMHGTHTCRLILFGQFQINLLIDWLLNRFFVGI